MAEDKEISKFYKFKSVTDQVLEDLFTYDNPSLAGCNIYEPYDKEIDMYVWVRVYDLSFFDSVEKILNSQEVDLEEIRKIELDFGRYKVRRDIP